MSTDKKTIESYNKYTIKCAEKMRSGKNIKHTFLEKPAMYKKLPNLKDKTVLCIGCGTGEECEHIKSLGAKRVVGIDISKERINFLKKSNPDLEFHTMDMEKMDFLDNSFDFIYSSLALHYSKDWTKILNKVHKFLKKDGSFLFSTHHPIKWGAEINKLIDKDSFLMGYKKSENGVGKVFGDYLTIRKINDVLSKDLKVSYYHRPISAMIRDIIKSGFIISDFIEPKPLKSVIKEKEKPDFYKIYSKIPLYMIFELRKI
jgi:ubiquinone/menaquinone biosynthesis C-methylase UbiE